MPHRNAAKTLAIHPDLVILARLLPETSELIATYANPAATRILGRPAEEIVDRPLRTLLIDGSPFSDKGQRDQFNAQLRALGHLEFPGLAQVRDARGRRRSLRIRLHWPAESDQIVVMGEDVTERNAQGEHSGAAERLRSSIEVSGLLSHHINNALTAALLSVEAAKMELRRSEIASARASLEQATAGMRTAAQVVAALAATARGGDDAAQSCEISGVLREVCAVYADHAALHLSLEHDAPHFVWGTKAQVEMILGGLLPLLPGGANTSVRVVLSRDAHEVRVELRAQAATGDLMRLLLDPTEPQPLTDTRAVRLFASVQVLRALGGQLGLPHWHNGELQVTIAFRAAPTLVEPTERLSSVLLLSRDGALRAIMSTLLPGRRLEYSESIRDGMVWLIRSDHGVVLCDVEDLEMPIEEVIALQRLVTGRPTHRFILLTRSAQTGSSLGLAELRIPFDRAQIATAITDAERSETRLATSWSAPPPPPR